MSALGQWEQLLKLAKRLDTGDLDETVYELLSQRAWEINEGGVETQLKLLVQELGLEQALGHIRRIIAERRAG